MLTRSHQICSVALVEALTLNTRGQGMLSVPVVLSLLVATAIGASIPDVDQPSSRINHWLPINLGHFFKHRGITHTIFGWLVFSILLFWLMNKVHPLVIWWPRDWWSAFYQGLSIGYLLHLLEDYFSNRSLNLFAPLIPVKGHRRAIDHWWGPGYQVGGVFELLCRYLALIAVVVMTVCWILRIVS